MKTSTSDGKHGVQWMAQNQLDDLEFSDHLALPSHTHQQMQMETTSVTAVVASVGLNIHKGKATSSNTTQRTPNNHIRLGNSGRGGISLTWTASSSMNEEDLMQMQRQGFLNQRQRSHI
ncbi:unnamed protein product [Schistosoma mattheei]|uniref:Uncharacterized protein n=1 Tax=Schistosoma mattheei TaxID=31246 RepID=A0A183PYT3_9TREM|nr:unnamed protein product [Schistosoma mattheei]